MCAGVVAAAREAPLVERGAPGQRHDAAAAVGATAVRGGLRVRVPVGCICNGCKKKGKKKGRAMEALARLRCP